MSPEVKELVNAWDDAQWEFSLVFEGLSDADLWKRAHPKLLSVGELAGHVCHWEAVMWGEETDAVAIKSPLVDKRFSYYTTSAADEPVVLDLTVAQVLEEMKRVHEEAKAAVIAQDPNLEESLPSNEKVKWANWLRYRSFHVAYHCGQAYSVRHMMGHTTTDN